MDDSQWMPPDPGRVAPPQAPQPEPHTSSQPAPSVPPAPTSPWSATPPPVPPPAGTPTEVPTVEAVGSAGADAGRPRRSKLLVGGGVVAVLAIGAAGVFAVQQYAGTAEGGAASPSELGTALMTAIEQEDVLGMVDTLVPGERDVMRDPLIDLVAELTRLDVLADNADLSSIAGFDIELDDEAVTAIGTNVADIVNVDMHADATVLIDGSVVPIGELITDNMDPDDVTELRGSSETQTDDFEASLTAVEEDGRWYFSLFHTAAEQIRADLDPVLDIPDAGIGAAGADSPEAAVEQMLGQIVALDVEGLIKALNPGEAAALQRYAPMFLDDVEAAKAELPPYEISIDSSELRSEGDGDTRTVFIDGLAVSGSFGEQGEQVRFEFSVSGDCVHVSAEGDSIEPYALDQCTGDALSSQPELEQALEDAPAITEFLTAVEESFADMQPVGLEVRQHDGSWYLSPTATYTEAVLKFLRALDRQEIDRLIELGKSGVEEFFDVALGGFFGVGDDGFDDGFDEGSGEAPAAYPSDDSTNDVFASVPTYPDESAAATTEPITWDRCYNERDATAATACFQEYVTSGEIDESFVPVALRHPECGYAELSWSGDIYSLGDAEFLAAADAARPCFMALVAAGSIEEYELPYEITRPECFEGRNWYATFDDPEYDERYWACVESDPTATTTPATTAPAG